MPYDDSMPHMDTIRVPSFLATHKRSSYENLAQAKMDRKLGKMCIASVA